MIEFSVDRERAMSAVHFLIREANARGQEPTQYDIVKSIFLADRASLNRYGRPVTFDKYVAMTHGPVPSFVYDTLKPEFNWSQMGLNAPWVMRPSGSKRYFSTETESPFPKKLSSSDQKELKNALTTILSLSFGQVRKLTHEDPAYVAAWRDEDGVNAFPMDMELFLEDRSDEAVDDVAYLAEMKA